MLYDDLKVPDCYPRIKQLLERSPYNHIYWLTGMDADYSDQAAPAIDGYRCWPKVLEGVLEQLAQPGVDIRLDAPILNLTMSSFGWSMHVALEWDRHANSVMCFLQEVVVGGITVDINADDGSPKVDMIEDFRPSLDAAMPHWMEWLQENCSR